MLEIKNKSILVLGLGNMASALIRGLLEQKCVEAKNIFAIVHGAKSQENAARLGLQTYNEAEHKNKHFDIVLLALKPQVMAEVLPKYKHLVGEQTLFLSVMAGCPVDKITHLLGGAAHVVRAMPNTPAAVGAGMAGLFAPNTITPAQKQIVEAFFTPTSHILWLEDESKMHVVTALSGSGPAYFYFIIEAMAKAAIAQGLNENDAYTLAIETCKGAGVYASSVSSSQSIEGLRKAVTSPGGTTEAGLKVMVNSDFEALINQVIEKAVKKSVSLSM